MEKLKKALFRYRSYTPIPFALLLIYQSDSTISRFIIGLFVALTGEFLRMISVRAAGGGTRTRKVGAKQLCTWGPYAHTRNPLYIANLLIYTGVIISASGPWIAWLGPLAIAYLMFQYGMIISLEENALISLFGNEYKQYMENVPRFFPRLKGYASGTIPEMKSLSNVLHNERRTLQNIFIIFLAILIRNLFF